MDSDGIGELKKYLKILKNEEYAIILNHFNERGISHI